MLVQTVGQRRRLRQPAGRPGDAGGSDLPAQRLDPARLRTQPVQPPPLRAGDALPLRGRARLRRLERQLHLVPRHRPRWPLGQPLPPPRRTDPHPPKTPPQPTPSGKHPSAPTASGNARAGVVKTASGSGDLRVPCRPFGQRSGSHSRTLRFALVVTGGHHLSQPGGDERRVRDTSGEEIRDVRHPRRIGHGQHLDDDVAVVAVSLRGKSSKGEACVGKDGRFEHLQERRGCDHGQMMASKTAPRSQFCTIECGVPVLIAPDTKTLVSSTTRTAPLRLGACFGGRPAPRRQPTPSLARPRGRHRWRRRSRRDRVEHQQSSTPTPHPR